MLVTTQIKWESTIATQALFQNFSARTTSLFSLPNPHVPYAQMPYPVIKGDVWVDSIERKKPPLSLAMI